VKLAVCDSRGNPSTTLVLVWAGYLVLLVKFAFAGFGDFPAMSGDEFAWAAGALLFGWGVREYTEKRPASAPGGGAGFGRSIDEGAAR
jgi:hypothetical protein